MENKIKEMPSSQEAENSVLGCILLDGEKSFDKVIPWIRNDNAFYTTDNKKIWKAVKILRKNKEPIDLITVANTLKEEGDDNISYYLSGLTDTIATTANIENHAKIVWEKYVQREVRTASYKMNKINNVSFDKYEKTMPLINNQLRWLEELRDLQPDRVNDLESMVEDAVEYIKSGENVIKFGMYALDKPAGGMTRKEVTVLGGRPGHGKTTLMINVLKSLIEQGYKVMLFNREMSNTEMLRKLIVLESKSLLYGNIRRGEIDGLEGEIDKAEQTIKEKYKSKV